ncbi:MAG: hypothetical protein HYR63_24765 [Proteobacteria bacterium]|nr:hypothetical protein [Pseudomonadota bacterium]
MTVATSGVGLGTVTSSQGGISCHSGSSSNCAQAFFAGTSISLTATPDRGYAFAGWSGACSGTGSALFTINADTSCTASFVRGPDPTVSASVAGSGTITSGSGSINCPGGSCSTTITWGSSITLTANASGNGSLVEWTGSCSGSAASFTLSNVIVDTACGARFAPPVHFTVTLDGSGVGQVTASSGGLVCSSGSCSADYAYNTAVTLTATPAAASTFQNWGGSCSGTSPSTTVTLLVDQTCTASFKSDQKRLTVTFAGTGTGIVSSVPSGINCNPSPAASICAATFDIGATVTLTAIAETPSVTNSYDQSRFDGWGGICSGTQATASVVMTAAQACTANFTKIKSGVTLTITLAGTKSGTVTSTPAGLTCLSTTIGRQCQARFAKDAQVSLSVAADAGARFVGWSGACTGRTVPFPLTLSVATACTASFSPGPIEPVAGAWWNPAEPGRGYGIEVQRSSGDAKIFFGSFVYTTAGPDIWYAGFLSPSDDGTSFVGQLTAYRGGQTLLGAYQTAVTAEALGQNAQPTRLTFTSPTTGTIEFPPLQAFAIGTTVTITRFPVVTGGLTNPRATAPTLPATGWWWNQAEPGRGLFLEAQADAAGNQVLFALFFLYGGDGSPRWYFGEITLASTGTAWAAASLSLYECSGGEPIGASSPTVANCVSVPGGQTTLQFSAAGDTALMTLSTGAQIALQRFTF